MYYSHFGLTQPPFRITPNTEFFFSGGNRGPILEALIYAISQGEGIVKVTGEVRCANPPGTGCSRGCRPTSKPSTSPIPAYRPMKSSRRSRSNCT